MTEDEWDETTAAIARAISRLASVIEKGRKDTDGQA